MKIKLDVALTTALVACAVVMTTLVVRREFFVQLSTTSEVELQQPVFMDNWQTMLEHGVLLGRQGAPVQLIEFADFECPFCASYHSTLKTLRERYPAQVSLYFVHYPLPMHRFAEPAALAAECARAQGRFEAMHDTLFEQQNQFGLKAWSEFALEVGVPDLSAFEMCIKNRSEIDQVLAGRKLGDELNVAGTPTIVINGWKVGRPPNTQELNKMVKAVLEGKSPMSILEK